MEMSPKTTDMQSITTLEERENINLTDQVSRTVTPVIAAIEMSTHQSTSHVQSMELNTGEVGSANIDQYATSIDLDNSLRESLKSEDNDDYIDERLHKILDSMDRLEQNSDRIDQQFDNINENCIKGDQATNIAPDPQTEINDDKSTADGTYSCDGCGGMIEGCPNSTWYRYTDCGDVDICHDCFMKDIHIHHKAYLQLFTAPPVWDSPHCDACGFCFTDNNGKLVQCTKCEDYCLCLKCHTNLHHFHHSKYLKEACILQYMKDIG